MKISLKESAKASLWFLGQPEALKVSLNFENRGPVEVDFLKLDQLEQEHVLRSAIQQEIELDEDLKTLVNSYNNLWFEKDQPIVVDNNIEPKVNVVKDEVKESIAKKISERDQKLQKDCADILSKTFANIKLIVNQTSDLKLLQTLVKVEQSQKNPRKNVLFFLNEEVIKAEKLIQEQVHKESKLSLEERQQAAGLKANYKEKVEQSMSVEESEIEIVEVPIPDSF